MRGLQWKRCLVYIDDILVFGNDFESALHSLELVLIRVAEYGLQLKSTTCNLFRTSVPFLGHIVGHAGLECDPNKLSAVANWIPPSTIKGVREFLGFTGYYRRFVPDYSTVAQPLVRLLGKDCKFKWTDACQDAFKAYTALQDKWLDEQFQTWTQIITARILSDPVFKQALLDSAGSPLCDPDEPVYATALTSARKMCVQRKLLCWPTWITLPTRVTRGQALA